MLQPPNLVRMLQKNVLRDSSDKFSNFSFFGPFWPFFGEKRAFYLKGKYIVYLTPIFYWLIAFSFAIQTEQKKPRQKILIFAEVRAFQSWKFQQPKKTQISNRGYFPSVDDVIWGVFAKLVYFTG